MRTYLLPPTGHLYKTNLHCHSTVSDGKFSPEQLKEMYRSKGYHAIAYTDHQVCVPHPELTDDRFVALSGIEIACGIRKTTSVHVCGIARNPMAQLEFPNDPSNEIPRLNAGIRVLKDANFITTLNHPRWSGIAPEELAAVDGVDNLEILNGYEWIQDGYGDSSACYEAEIRRGRKARPIATDDTHTNSPEGPGYEYFRGFTVVKAPELTYGALIDALDAGAYFASSGPMLRELWLEDGMLHVECDPVCGIYVHGNLYSHRAAKLAGSDCLTCADLDVSALCASANYLFVQIVNTSGARAWAAPLWLK